MTLTPPKIYCTARIAKLIWVDCLYNMLCHCQCKGETVYVNTYPQIILRVCGIIQVSQVHKKGDRKGRPYNDYV